ncbi:MAG: DUF86 domain-containing protein [Nitrososphaeria archaeon]|nr:DUF86 domain-containing protein [Nitrososphaeria archaeon]
MLKRLERFNKGIEILNEIRNYDRDIFCKDIKILSIAERNLQVCIEFLIDMSTYILSKLDAEIPETYREVVEKLYDEKVIDEDLKEKLAEIIGLRNIIVHMYADIIPELLYDNLKDIMNVLKISVKRLLEFCQYNNIDP